ncbi:hypothetical protein N0V93_007329 [Gnomoniopsis smithogilvyi]|uniref:Uncharacterized protein n=1 Tax=Gnomoniopsis smithogilvyi TaxID=1191159 RepID=A0A9W9CWJ6_9PEZI|nr:hypothetical protein N0V93_007329 [Gnomoniopsis smithogilvyi]
MRPTTIKALAGSALLSLAAQPADATLGHRHFHHRHSGNHTHGHTQDVDLVKRGRLVNRAGQCAFPEDEGLVTITPTELNAGWALSPDQECTAGSYCPYACPPGQLMNQWKPGSTYVYPDSMDGGAYCDENGIITKPFPEEDYCVEGIGNVQAVNNCGDEVAVCQTVLPGNEAMLIPTSVGSSALISVPGTSYWDSTAAHFYVNQPGHTTEEACIWGDGSTPIGNWAAYVIGTNQDATGNTYVKAGWNPIYTDAFPGVKPKFGVKIECDGTCVGLPCSIDPSTDGFGGVNSEESATGAGGADFCVVTVTSGSANVVFFNTDGSTGSGSSSSSATSVAVSEPATTKPKPTSSQAAVVVVGLHAVATTSSTSTSSSKTTPRPTTSTTSVSSSTEISTTLSTTSTTSKALSSSTPVTSYPASTTLARPSASGGYGGVFQESDGTTNGTLSSGSTASGTSSAAQEDTTAAAPAATTSSKSNASKDQAAFAGLVVAIVAAACLY